MQKAAGGTQSGAKMRASPSKQKLLIDAVKAAETGQQVPEPQRMQQLDRVFSDAVPNIAQGKLIVFSQNGQTFIRNHDASKVAQLTIEQQ